MGGVSHAEDKALERVATIFIRMGPFRKIALRKANKSSIPLESRGRRNFRSEKFTVPSNSVKPRTSKGGALKAHPMKKLIPVLSIAIITLFAAPLAEARGCRERSYVSFHRSCGGPAWVETYVAYYDACGHPVFRTRVLPVRHHHSHSYEYSTRYQHPARYRRCR